VAERGGGDPACHPHYYLNLTRVCPMVVPWPRVHVWSPSPPGRSVVQGQAWWAILKQRFSVG